MKNKFFTSFSTPLEMVNRLRMMFYILVGFSLPFFLVIYLQTRNSGNNVTLSETENYLRYIVASIVVFNAIIAYYFYGMSMKKARKQQNLRRKLEIVLESSLYKFLLMEISAILTIIVYYMTQDIAYAGIYIVQLVLFSMSNPTVYTVNSDLKLPKKEADAMKQNIPIWENH